MLREYGKYRLIDKIAQGAMGEILLVENGEGEKFALKTLKTDAVESSESFQRFKREVELSKQLENPHIVKVYDFDLCSKNPYMVMEYMKNGTLDERLQREMPLEPLEVLKIGIEIAEALRGMHKLEITHRDIKPANILIAEDGSYKLSDLGLAGLTGEARNSGNENLTMSQTALGTPYYIAPEQAENAAHVDIRADIYSLGATLYYCLTGERVHEGNSSIHVMMKHVNDSVINPRELKTDLPENICAVIMKMLEKDLKRRYQSPNSLLSDLEKIKEYDAPAEDLIASKMSLSIPAQKNRAGMIMFLCLAVIITFAAYAFFKSSFAPPDKADKFYQKDRIKVKEIKAEQSAEFLIQKAAAVEKFLIDYPTEEEGSRMKLAADAARVLSSTKIFHINVKKAGNLLEARSFAFRVFLNGKKSFDYESNGQKKFIYPDARMILSWEPGVKIKLQLEEFDWQNEIMYDAVLPNFFSLRGLSGDKIYRVKPPQDKFFQGGLLQVEYTIDEISEESWKAFEDYIYPGAKW